MRSDRRNLWILLAAGIIVRLIGITYGLPSAYNSTEYFIAKHALSFGARQTAEPLYFIYPTFYPYLMAAVYALFFVAGRILGFFPTPADFALQFFADPAMFYLLGRLLNAFAVIAALLIFYRAVRFLLAERVALGVSLLFLFSFNLYRFTFWMVPDAFLILGTVIVLFYIIKIHFQLLSFREIIAASLICGLTVSTKYNAGFLALGWLLAVWLAARPAARRLKTVSVSALAVLTGFLLATPYWMLSFAKFAGGFRTIWSQSRYSYNFQSGLPYLWEFQELLRSEWLLGLVLILLLFTLLFNRDRRLLPLAAVTLPTFLLVGSWEKKGLDYLLVIFPALLLVLAYWIRILQEKYRRGVLLNLLVVAMVLLNFPRVIYQVFLHTRTDTRQLTGRWVMSHLPPQSAICYDHYHYDIDLIDVERYLDYGAGSRFLSRDIRQKLQKLRRAPNNYRFIPAQKQLENPDVPPERAGMVEKDPFLWESLTHPHKTLAEIAAAGAQLLILNSDTYLKFLNNPPPSPENPLRADFLQRRNFYRNVFNGLKPLKTLRPAWDRPGPVILIFNLRNIQ